MLRMRHRSAAALLCSLSLVAAAACSKSAVERRREHIASGDKYASKQQFAEAVVEYRNAVQADPSSGEARYKLGEAYVRTQNPGAAYGEFVRAADLMPTDVPAQVAAGQMHLLAGQFKEAQARAEQILSRDPKNI